MSVQYLFLGNSALIVPAVMINQARRPGDEREEYEKEGLNWFVLA
jgi:hypothetical protein